MVYKQFVCVCVCVCVCARARMLSHVWLFATPGIIACQAPLSAHQAPLSIQLPRQEYWSEFRFPIAGDLPDPGTELLSPVPCIVCGLSTH